MIIRSSNRRFRFRESYNFFCRGVSQFAIEVNCEKNEKLLRTVDFLENHLPSSLIQGSIFESLDKDTNNQWWKWFGNFQVDSSFGFTFSDNTNNHEFSSTLPFPPSLQKDQIRHRSISLKLNEGESSKSVLREIVFPHDMRIVSSESTTLVSDFMQSHYEKKKGYPNIYSISHTNSPHTHVNLRVFPTTLPTMIAYTDKFDEIMHHLNDQINQSKDIPSEIISGTHFFQSQNSLSLKAIDSREEEKERQIQFLSLYEIGLDFRITNCPEIPFSFLEGSNVFLQQTVPELQSNRLLGGDASIRETKFGYSGDCWSETRTMTKYKMASYLPQFLQSLIPIPASINSLSSLQREKRSSEEHLKLVKRLWKKGGPSMKE